MKKFFKILGYTFLSLILLLTVLFLWGEVSKQYNYNHKYSIAMPIITGEFDTKTPVIHIAGLKNIINEQIATLSYSELYCMPSYKTCNENSIVISGWGDSVYLNPFNEEYKIKYIDKDKIFFANLVGNVTGEIDLNSKTLIYTLKNNDEIRKVEILTDNKKIEELEKKIISKYLKIKPFRR